MTTRGSAAFGIALDSSGGIPASGVNFLQAGPSAVLRTVQDRMRDWVSVFDYMTAAQIADIRTRANTLDVTTALQAIYDAFPGCNIYHPAGLYRTSALLTITNAKTRPVGAGSGSTEFRMITSTTADQFKFATTTPTTTTLGNCGISGISISRQTNSTTGAGVHCIQCIEFKLDDVIVTDYPEGIKVEGGTLSNYQNFQLYATDNLTGAPVANSSLLSFTEAPLSGGLFQIPYTTTVSNFKIAGTRHIDSQVIIRACDGLSFVNGYIGNGYNANIRIKSQTAAQYIAALSFTNVYVDGVSMSASGTTYGLDIPTDSLGTSFVYDVAFVNCKFLNYGTSAVIATEGFSVLNFQNCLFSNIRGWAMDITGVNTLSNFTVNGCNFRDVGTVTASTGGITASALANCVITNNEFQSIAATGTGTGIVLAGTSVNGNIDGNVFNSVTTNVTNSATWTGKISGVWVTFTPALTFATPGDLATVYSVQIGRYIRKGGIVTAVGALTATTFTHTTASGNFQITGLPVAATATVNIWTGTMLFNGITKATYTQFLPRLDSSGTLMTVQASGSGVAVATLTTADVPTGGTKIINFTMMYEALP